MLYGARSVRLSRAPPHTNGFRTSSGERAMKKRTIGILATGVAVTALCVITDASAIAGHSGGGGGGGGWHGGGVGGGAFHGFAARRRLGPHGSWVEWPCTERSWVVSRAYAIC